MANEFMIANNLSQQMFYINIYHKILSTDCLAICNFYEKPKNTLQFIFIRNFYIKIKSAKVF